MKVSCVAFTCVLFFCITGYAAELTSRVVAIADGDTVTVLDAQNVQHKIRLAGIDAPEKKQPFGNRSKEALSDCAFNKDVVINWDKIDRYQRKVGKVIVAGVDCNLRQIDLGMAWHYKEYEKEQTPADRDSYAKAELQARSARKGVWSDNEVIAPWVFRKAQKTK